MFCAYVFYAAHVFLSRVLSDSYALRDRVSTCSVAAVLTRVTPVMYTRFVARVSTSYDTSLSILTTFENHTHLLIETSSRWIRNPAKLQHHTRAINSELHEEKTLRTVL